jgi:Xaa-Pro aminopeptidase
METQTWDAFVTGNFRTVYYLTGVLTAADAPTALVLWNDGTSALITSSPTDGHATETIKLETYSIQRTITRSTHEAASLLKDVLAKKQSRSYAVDRPGTPGLYEALIPAAADATDAILKIRKRKEEDEIDEIRQSLEYCKAAYRAAKAAIAPGLTEIDIYNAMYSEIVKAAGATIHFAGDFACGARGIKSGGPPTNRAIQPGDFYILDIFPAPALYFGDVCRTFAAGIPTDKQHHAWELVMEAVRIGEEAVKPGVEAKTVYAEIKDFLDSHEITEKSFWHHAGHGIGHHGHEAPRIIPGTDDIFEIGDVFTLEPGVYTQALQGGIRLEDNYVLRENGLENLFTFPKEI